MNVSEQLLDILVDSGVKQIFGVTGDALNYFVNAVNKRDDVEWIGVRHEGNGAYAAFAQGALSGKLGICAGTVGPGALHLINGLYNAKKERTPVVAITGQVPLEYLGTDYFQEADLTKIFDDVCEYQATIRSPEEAPHVIQRAIKVAMGSKAVCRIELPVDVAEMKAKSQEFVHPISLPQATLVPDQTLIEEAATIINKSDKVAILAGAGCRGAKEDVLKLAARLKAPIVYTLRAADLFRRDDPNVVGMTGLLGNPAGNDALNECDLLIMLGSNFPYIDFLPHKAKTIQVDIRLENIGNRTPVSLGILGDVQATLARLGPHCEQVVEDAFLSKLSDDYTAWLGKMRDKASLTNDHEPLHPQLFARQINELASDDAIFTIDTGESAIWAARHISFGAGRRAIGSFNFGSMAVGLPAAIGAQLQYPDREVWGLVGDGAFTMAMQDFLTAVDCELPIKLIVFNNSELGLVKMEMEEAGLAPNLNALGLRNINFADYARLCGGEGIRVEHAKDVKRGLETAKSSSRPFIIDAVVTSGELPMPPEIKWSQAFGFAESKIKELFKALSGSKAQWDNLAEEIKAQLN